MKNKVGLFFFVDKTFLFHGCEINAAEYYGDFLVYPKSHFEIWEKRYETKYHVDFDYYPRGRIVYRKTDDTYIIYYDRCIENWVRIFKEKYAGENIILALDEHYQCHFCNQDYML